MKRVFAFMRGGIGNQMFIYAAARAVCLRNDAQLVLLTDSFENESHGRHFLLDNFNIKANVGGMETIASLYNAGEHRRVVKYNRYLHLLPNTKTTYAVERCKTIWGKQKRYDPRIVAIKFNDHVFLDGLFQSPEYFSDIPTNIRDDFSLASSSSAETERLANILSGINGVCIHFRRTELEHAEMAAKHGNTTKWLGGYKVGLGKEYYDNAITYILNHVSDPIFYCFSDFPEWVRDNFNLPSNTVFVSHNNTAATCHEDIYLMSQCKHHIISHSTFGWWGAWLGAHNDQIVIAPNNINGRRKPPYYPQAWHTIDVYQLKAQ